MEGHSSFSTRLLTDMKEWVTLQLYLGLSVQHVMAHYRKKLFQAMSQTKGDPMNIFTHDMFFTHQNVRNLASKKATETYYLHQNNALNVRM